MPQLDPLNSIQLLKLNQKKGSEKSQNGSRRRKHTTSDKNENFPDLTRHIAQTFFTSDNGGEILAQIAQMVG